MESLLSRTPGAEGPQPLEPTASLIAEDSTFVFFLADCDRRLGRAAEVSFSYFGFLGLLYLRFCAVWPFLEPASRWPLVFLPLFAVDVRSVLRARELYKQRAWFHRYNAFRTGVASALDAVSEALLCIYLAFPGVRIWLPIVAVVVPHICGCAVYVVLGQNSPLVAAPIARAVGFNRASSLLTEFWRIFLTLLTLSLAIRVGVGDEHEEVYSWYVSFWPVWALDAILVLFSVVLCIFSMATCAANRVLLATNQPDASVLIWGLVSALVFAAASCFSCVNAGDLLEERMCPTDPGSPSEFSKDLAECRRQISLVVLPWLIVLPSFSAFTLVLRPRLALQLHASWYQVPSARRGAPEVEIRQAPEVMFRLKANMSYGRDPVTLLSPRSIAQTSDGDSAVRPCFICLEAEPDAILLECGHGGLCCVCAENLLVKRLEARGPPATCPICRTRVAQVLRMRQNVPVPERLFQHEAVPGSVEQDEDGGRSSQDSLWPRVSSRHAVVVEVVCRWEDFEVCDN